MEYGCKLWYLPIGSGMGRVCARALCTPSHVAGCALHHCVRLRVLCVWVACRLAASAGVAGALVFERRRVLVPSVVVLTRSAPSARLALRWPLGSLAQQDLKGACCACRAQQQLHCHVIRRHRSASPGGQERLFPVSFWCFGVLGFDLPGCGGLGRWLVGPLGCCTSVYLRGCSRAVRSLVCVHRLFVCCVLRSYRSGLWVRRRRAQAWLAVCLGCAKLTAAPLWAAAPLCNVLLIYTTTAGLGPRRLHPPSCHCCARHLSSTSWPRCAHSIHVRHAHAPTCTWG